jgi:hypothetical protein
MPYYHAYHVDDEGHVVSRLYIYADDDEQAVEKDKQRQDGRDIEVWYFEKVALLKHQD